MESVTKNLLIYIDDMDGSASRRKEARDKSKSIKKSKSFNFLNLIKEGSNRLNHTAVAAADKSGREIAPDVDESV